MANSLSNTKSLTGKSVTNGGADFVAQNITLIYPNETLVKKEDKSVVVRNEAGKLVRRTSPDGFLSDVYNLIQDGEVFVREEETRLIVRNKAGKLVARPIIIEEVLEEDFEDISSDELADVEADESEMIEESDEDFEEVEVEDNDEEEELEQEEAEEAKAPVSDSLRERLKSRHSFLDRIDRGERVGVVQTLDKEANFKPVNSELVEEIDEEEEEILPDAEVLQLEDAVTEDSFNRSQGRVSGKGRRAGDRGTYVSGGAKNPNEKPNLGGSAVSKGLVGNYALATPEKEVVIPVLEKKPKKERKPVKPWVIVVALVSIYVLGMMTYFFIGYNFEKKSVGIILYYIDIGEHAKLEYYDGEQFNYNDMKMTLYYSDDKIESFNITSENFADTTVGMGYTINDEYINARWQGSETTKVVKVKFAFDNLICYVPVTIHRNKLKELKTYFTLSSLEAGQEISPTVFGVYTNTILEARNEKIYKVLPLNLENYHLILRINGFPDINLKALGCYSDGKYTLPEEYDHDNDPATDNIKINYSGSVQLIASVSDNNITRNIVVYPKSTP